MKRVRVGVDLEPLLYAFEAMFCIPNDKLALELSQPFEAEQIANQHWRADAASVKILLESRSLMGEMQKYNRLYRTRYGSAHNRRYQAYYIQYSQPVPVALAVEMVTKHFSPTNTTNSATKKTRIAQPNVTTEIPHVETSEMENSNGDRRSHSRKRDNPN